LAEKPEALPGHEALRQKTALPASAVLFLPFSFFFPLFPSFFLFFLFFGLRPLVE